MSLPTVSVIIPCYNRAGLVAETIDNMLNQSHPPHEIIVVDDGSTDESVKVVREFGSRVILLEQENQGPGAARNNGYMHATGDYIQFMDSDDLISLNKLEIQVKALEEVNADLAYCPWIRVMIKGDKLETFGKVMQQRAFPVHEELAIGYLCNWSFLIHCWLFRKSFLDQIELFRTDIYVAEDMDFFLRVFLQPCRVVHTPEPLALYRVGNPDALSSSGTASEASIYGQARFILDSISHLKKYKADYDPLMNPIFRLRLWQHYRSLESIHSREAKELRGKFSEILGLSKLDNVMYALKTKAGTLMGGVRSRLTGSRFKSHYGTASLSPKHTEMLHQLGYHNLSHAKL